MEGFRMKGRIDGKRVFEKWRYQRGDIYYVNLNPFRGSEQGGIRPCLVIQNNLGNRFAPTLIVVTITSRHDKKGSSTHYLLKGQRGLPSDSLVECEQIHTIDKSRIIRYLGRVSKEDMKQIESILCYSIGVHIAGATAI